MYVIHPRGGLEKDLETVISTAGSKEARQPQDGKDI